MARDNRKNVFLKREEAELAMRAIRLGSLAAISADMNPTGAALASVAECLDGLLNGFDAMVIGDPYADLPQEQRP